MSKQDEILLIEEKINSLCDEINAVERVIYDDQKDKYYESAACALSIGGENYFHGINWIFNPEELYLKFLYQTNITKLEIKEALLKLNWQIDSIKLQYYNKKFKFLMRPKIQKREDIINNYNKLYNLIEKIELSSLFFEYISEDSQSKFLEGKDCELSEQDYEVYYDMFNTYLQEFNIVYTIMGKPDIFNYDNDFTRTADEMKNTIVEIDNSSPYIKKKLKKKSRRIK